MLRVIMLLLVALPLCACSTTSTTEKMLIKATPTVVDLRAGLKTEMDAECAAVATKCHDAGVVKIADCKELAPCWERRATVYKIAAGVELAIKTGLNFTALGAEAQAKAILVQVTASLLELYQKLQAYKVINLK